MSPPSGVSVYSFQRTFSVDDTFHSKVIRRQVGRCPKLGPNFHVFGSEILRGGAPKIFDRISSQKHRRIADEYCGGAAVTKFPTKAQT